MEVSVGIYTIIFIFFFLIIPGFLARRFYFNGEFSKQINISIGSLLNLIYSFFVGVILSLFFVAFLNLIANKEINIDEVLGKFDKNFVVQNQNLVKEDKFTGFSENMYSVYLPFIGGMYVFSSIIGFFISKVVLFFGWDTKWKFFRYGNNWHYLFSGKILKFKRHSSSLLDHKLKVKYTYLDILVSEKGDETTLYSGLFADYDICPNDISKLEKVHLLKATRYKKTNDTVIVKNIPGNLFTIMGDRILNINCTYICFEEEESRDNTFMIKRKILVSIQILTTLFFLTILISFVFNLNIFNSIWFNNLLSKPILTKLIYLFFLNVIIGLITPFKTDYDNKKIVFNGWGDYFSKIVLIIGMWLFLEYVIPFVYNLFL